MNKTLLKLACLLFCFSVIDVLVISYWLIRCGQTQSGFYCDSFMFGGIFFLLGIPALILLGLSLIVLAFSKWYKGNVSTVAKSAIVILGVIILVAPYTPFLLSNKEPRTYRDSLIRAEQQREERCAMFRQELSPSLVSEMPVLHPECN